MNKKLICFCYHKVYATFLKVLNKLPGWVQQKWPHYSSTTRQQQHLNCNLKEVHCTVSNLLSNTKWTVPLQCHGMFVHFFSRSFCSHAFWVTVNNLHLINLPLITHTDFNYTTKLSVCCFKKVKMIGKHSHL